MEATKQKYECKIIYKQNKECFPLLFIVTATNILDAKKQANTRYVEFVREATETYKNDPEGAGIDENILDRLPVIKSIDVYPYMGTTEE